MPQSQDLCHGQGSVQGATPLKGGGYRLIRTRAAKRDVEVVGSGAFLLPQSVYRHISDCLAVSLNRFGRLDNSGML